MSGGGPGRRVARRSARSWPAGAAFNLGVALGPALAGGDVLGAVQVMISPTELTVDRKAIYH